MDVVGAAIDVTVAMHLWGRRQTHPDDGDRAPESRPGCCCLDH
jgi:hypothetical protein